MILQGGEHVRQTPYPIMCLQFVATSISAEDQTRLNLEMISNEMGCADLFTTTTIMPLSEGSVTRMSIKVAQN